MTIVAFDTLKFAKRLRESGFTEVQAEALAEAIKDAGGEAELATKRDLKELENNLRRDLNEVESNLKHDIKEVKHDIQELEYRLIIKLGIMMGALVGILKALDKLLA
jgi:phage tail tape-measure protein